MNLLQADEPLFAQLDRYGSHTRHPHQSKALKVAELKEILTKSSIPIPRKANKADLIARILTTPDMLRPAGGNPAPAKAVPAEALRSLLTMSSLARDDEWVVL
ncbi:HeH/LEM domain protein, partial [Rhizoctonia solani AG-3 Rhs1AP]